MSCYAAVLVLAVSATLIFVGVYGAGLLRQIYEAARRDAGGRSAMSQVEQRDELERVLTRQRMILEQLHVHLEGLAPHTWAAIQASSRVKEAVAAIRSLKR